MQTSIFGRFQASLIGFDTKKSWGANSKTPREFE